MSAMYDVNSQAETATRRVKTRRYQWVE